MSRLEIRLKQRVRELQDALRPFAEQKVTQEGDVWFYVGTQDPDYPAPLHTNAFLNAKKVLGIHD